MIRLVGLALASAVAAGLFYTHMDLPPPSGALRLALSDPVPVLLALGRFFGAPLARILGGSPLAAQALPAAEALGLAGTAMAAGFWLSFLRAPRQNAPAALWLGILALALIWGGSVSIRDAVEPGPVLSRYDLIVSLFWSALVVLTVRRMPGFGSGPLLGLAMMLLVLQFPFGLRAIAQAEIVAATRIALAVGVDDPAIEARRGYGEDMARVRPLLLARALPPFNDEAARAVGSAQSPMADGPSCAAGQVNEAVSLPTGGLRLLGQGGVPKGPFLLRIIDSDGQLSGLGERWRGPADLFGRASEPEGWLAYLRPNAKPPFHLLAIGQDGAACRILSRQ
ncbi:MAG: hypothetical protein HY055_17505 [Magnetospirillum sp.]|nr:hypothetical protein [Magnetospirillum sp.]